MNFLEANNMTKAPHTPYLLDLAASDFLFGNVKSELSGYYFDSADHLLTAIHHILDGYDRPTLINIFEK
jgi:hypothetical protein